jgi:hypothetical protein
MATEIRLLLNETEHRLPRPSRQPLGIDRADAADHSEARYRSIPSIVVGWLASRKDARNCCPWVRSFTQAPLIWTNSPAMIIAAWLTTVIRSRCPRALTRSTQKPFSGLWNVTRSTKPAGFGGGCLGDFRHCLGPSPESTSLWSLPAI